MKNCLKDNLTIRNADLKTVYQNNTYDFLRVDKFLAEILLEFVRLILLLDDADDDVLANTEAIVTELLIVRTATSALLES
jgi:hypothetical protein